VNSSRTAATAAEIDQEKRVRHSTSIRGLLVIGLVLAASSPRVAAAQSAGDADRAEKLFTEASTLAAAGNYAAACPKFEESQRLDGALGTQFNLALCFEKIGRLGSAWRNFRAVERLAHQTMKTGRESAAHQKLEQLRPRVPHLVIAAPDADVTVKVDGELVERDAWSFYAVDPGEHVIDATAPAKTSWRGRIKIEDVPGKEGTEQKVAVPALVTAPGETRIVKVNTETSNPKRTIGFVVGGVGVAGIAVAVVTGIALLNDKSIADERCVPTCSDESARSAVATGKTLVPINVIAWGVGLVGVGVGSFLLLTAGGSKPSRAASLGSFVTANGGGALLRF
jgi:hypothetical protein